MLHKLMYDSWKSRMELYMANRENGYLILESIINGPLNWPMVEENGATNIILQGVPLDIYALCKLYDTYDSDCDEVNNAKVSLMATLSSCDSSVLFEVPNSSDTNNDLPNSVVQEKLESEQPRVNQDTPNSFSDLENEINLLKQTLSQESKEKEALLKTVNVLKRESSELESKSLETEIALSKKIKQLDNIVYKMGQSAQTVHMLTNP
ncbi:hypothetical protein Tco_0829309 [Tanacetum coccineum]